jgi:HSP20 family protein
MSLIPWKMKRADSEQSNLPVRADFRSEMDRLFNSFFGDALDWGGREVGAFGQVSMPLDVQESDKDVVVRAEIAGVKPEDLEISIVGNSLVIAGQKKEEASGNNGGAYYQERRYGSFRREVQLPTAVEADNVQADYKDGVLAVHLHKSQEALPKKIKVTSS